MRIGVLGELQVEVDGRPVTVRRGKPRTVLLSLVMAAGDTVPAAQLIDRIWVDDDASNPANALQTLVAYLRRTFAAAGVTPVLTRGAGYALDLRSLEVDAHLLEQHVRDARELAALHDVASLARAEQLLQDALALRRGEPYADVAGQAFVAGEAARLSELAASATELRGEVLLALGRAAEAVQALRLAVREEPLRERLHEQLVVALYRSGRQGEALQAYADARRVLADELGVDPGPSLRRLEQLVLTQDPALDWVPPQSSAAPSLDAPGAAAPSVLPVPPLPLVGRDAELEKLGAALASSRVVTVTGPGGAGKSRLALELARTAGRPATWVDLSAVAEQEDVAPAVAAALGIATPPGADVLDQLRATTRTAPLLLVLDTCEHVVEAAAAVASAVVRSWPETHVLATSRRPLEIAGERTWPLGPLAVPAPHDAGAKAVGASPAVQLFVARAAAADPVFSLTDDVAADVATVCVALDGLPLAVELAAALCDVLPPAVIRERLDERFGLLVRGPRDLVPRQRTLRATIDWSVELLAPDERRALARLAVFQGPFSLDAAADVSGADAAEALDRLTALVRQSLVVRLDGGYFTLLDSLRAYAAELLAEDQDADAVRARHALHYARVAETGDTQMRLRGQDAWVVRLRSEMGNFRAALAWCFSGGAPELGGRIAAALAWLWAHEGMLRDAEHWLEQASRVVAADPLTRANVLTRKAMYLLPLGRLREAEAAAAQAYVLAAQAGDDSRAGAALIELGVAQWALGDLGAARTSHTEAVERLSRGDDAYLTAMASVLVARTAVDAGEPDADEVLAGALTAIRAVGDAHMIAIALHCATRSALARGDVAEADEHGREALQLARHVGYQEGIVAGLLLLSDVAAQRGAAAQARQLAVEALRVADRIGHVAGTCEALERLAALLAADPEPQHALRLLLAAERLRDHHGVPVRVADRPRAAALRAELSSRVGPHPTGAMTAAALVRPLDLVESLPR